MNCSWSAAAALGRDWLGVTPAEGTTLFIDAEDDEQVIHKRLADILRHYGAKFADVKDRLHLVSLAGKDSALGFYSRDRSAIKPTQLYNHLLEMAGDLKPKIIGIASSADVFAGNEIDRLQVQQFIGLLTRLARWPKGSTVLIAHPSLTGISSDTGRQRHNAVAQLGKGQVLPEEHEATRRRAGRPAICARSCSRKIIMDRYRPASRSDTKTACSCRSLGATLNVEARREQISAVFMAILKRFNGDNRNCQCEHGRKLRADAVREGERGQGRLASKEDLAGAMRTLLEERVIMQEHLRQTLKPRTIGWSTTPIRRGGAGAILTVNSGADACPTGANA